MNVKYDFTDRTVIVTGAARGIGQGVGELFTRAGANVVLVDRDEAELKTVADDLGAIAAPADVSVSADVDAVVASTVERFGGVDILVNNAGILRDNVVWKITDEDWHAVLAVHAGGTFNFTRACVPHFRAKQYGRIINVTSYTGLHGNTGQANYATAKAGIIGFTKTTAKELARFGVTVNAISPNAETRMSDSMPPEKMAQIVAGIPLGRFAAPGEMAPAIAFLASEEASYITGAILPVDGGLAI